MRRLKRAKNNEDESDSKIFQGVEFGESYFGKRNSRESHDRSKRSRRSFVADSNFTNNQRDIPENINYRETQMIKDSLKNVTSQNTEEVVTKLYSSYLSDGKNLMNVSNKINISDLQYSLNKKFFSNNHFNNLTNTPSIANKTNIFGLKYSSNTELYLDEHFINDKSLFDIKTNTHSPERIIKNEVPKTILKEISQRSTTEMILKTIDHIAENHTNSPDFEKNVFIIPNGFIDSISLSTNDDADDSGKSLKNQNGEEKLGIAAQKILRFSADDGQSKGVEKKFPSGNMSHRFRIATNESRSCVVETTVTLREKEIEADETRKRNREPIPGVIKIFEPRGRPYQKQDAEATARLSRRMGKDGTKSVTKMKTDKDEADESRNTNARKDSSTLPIDSVTDATMKPEAAYINTSETGKSIILKDLTLMIVDNNLQKQQQMVPPLSAESRSANKLNGNLDTDRIDIPVFGSNGNETMNVKEGTETIMEAHEYHKSDNNLQRKLLWISTISDGETGDASIKSTRSIFNTTTKNYIENIMNENRQQSKITGSAHVGKKVLTRIKREDTTEENRILQDALNSQISETNRNVRFKRSIYPYLDNLESNNEAENIAEKEAAINYDEKQENNEEYQNVEELKGLYNDREDVFEGIMLI